MTDGTRKNGRSTDGRFAVGNSGRPHGSRNRATLAIESLLQDEAERLGRQAVNAALDGDSTALRLCLERIAPARKDSAVSFDLPEIRNAADAAGAAAAVLQAVADGDLTPSEAQNVMGLLTAYVGIQGVGDLESRLAALEAAESTR